MPSPPRLGLGAYSCSLNWRALRDGRPPPRFRDTLSFLDYAQSLGAAGVQCTLRPNDRDTAREVRRRIDELNAYYEGELTLPRDDADVDRFARDVQLLRDAGATVARTAALSGRRYENFHSAAEFADFRRRAEGSFQLAARPLREHRLRLAVENHKDWLVSEQLDWLQHVDREWIGVCVDTGNNLALLEDPLAVVEALAPHAFSVHLKDMAFLETDNGFLLSEVPLGDGFLDLPRIVSILRQANPDIAFNLEMITRDPLRVPCLTPDYWNTFPGTPARRLAEAIARIKSNLSPRPLPQITGKDPSAALAFEEENNRQSIRHARQALSL